MTALIQNIEKIKYILEEGRIKKKITYDILKKYHGMILAAANKELECKYFEKIFEDRKIWNTDIHTIKKHLATLQEALGNYAKEMPKSTESKQFQPVNLPANNRNLAVPDIQAPQHIPLEQADKDTFSLLYAIFYELIILLDEFIIKNKLGGGDYKELNGALNELRMQLEQFQKKQNRTEKHEHDIVKRLQQDVPAELRASESTTTTTTFYDSLSHHTHLAQENKMHLKEADAIDKVLTNSELKPEEMITKIKNIRTKIRFFTTPGFDNIPVRPLSPSVPLSALGKRSS